MIAFATQRSGGTLAAVLPAIPPLPFTRAPDRPTEPARPRPTVGRGRAPRWTARTGPSTRTGARPAPTAGGQGPRRRLQHRVRARYRGRVPPRLSSPNGRRGGAPDR